MLDLIYDTRTMDPGDAVWMELVRDTYFKVYNNKSNNFVSAVEKNLPLIEKAINGAIETFNSIF